MRSSIACVVVALGLATGCGKGDKPPPPTSGSPNAKPETGPPDNAAAPSAAAPAPAPAVAAGTPAEEAASMFRTVCATCHGPEGRGNGPAASNMNPKPRDYTDAAWQASVNDEEL